MLLLFCYTHDLRNLGFGNLVAEDATDALALGMDLEHNLRGPRALHPEDRLKDINDELHRREVIIDQNHAVERGSLDLRASFFDSQVIAALLLVFFVLVTHDRFGDIRSVFGMSIASACQGCPDPALYMEPMQSRYIIAKYRFFAAATRIIGSLRLRDMLVRKPTWQDMITKANWTDFSGADGSTALTTVNRVLPPWVSLLLVIAISWQIARVIWMLVPGTAAGDAVDPPMNIPTSTSASRNQTDVQAIASKHMFGEADADDTVAAPLAIVDDNLSDTRLTNLILKGTIASDIPEFSVAVIADNNADQKVYAIGDPITSGANLHAIYPERVVLNENGALTNLKLPTEFPAAQAAQSRRTTNATRRTKQNTASIQNVVADNLSSLSDVIRPTPYLVNGEQAGYRVYPGRNRAQFAALGLRPGDLVKDIDGQTLTDPTQAMQIFQSLGTAEQVTVTVERNGQSQSIVLKTSQLDMSGEQTK